MRAYYNEIEPYAAEWLRNLIAEGLIAPGDVDERSIEEVAPDELEGYTQCHFFAGIGGWGHALRLAGWPDERPVWTGSVPCQPLSSAGQRRGHADRRHLWPAFFRLIAERRPATVFGEQVASNLGREWLAGVRADLEHVGYACGAADLPAACVGAPHIRQRLWWVAHSERPERRSLNRSRGDARVNRLPQGQEGTGRSRSGGTDGGLADNLGERYAPIQQRGTGDVRQNRERERSQPGSKCSSSEGIQRSGQHGFQPEDDGAGGGLDHTAEPRCPGPLQPGTVGASRNEARMPEPQRRSRTRGLGDDDDGRLEGPRISRGGQPGVAWAGEYIPCGDGKARRIESGTFPLAHGVPNRVGRLRAYGNAIVPQVAAAFIRAYRDVKEVA